MILNIKRKLPEYAKRAIEKCDFKGDDYLRVRRCVVAIPEEDATTYIDPESFDFMEVYGECELTQAIMDGTDLPIMISKYQFEKDRRSFDDEAAAQTHRLLRIEAVIEEHKAEVA